MELLFSLLGLVLYCSASAVPLTGEVLTTSGSSRISNGNIGSDNQFPYAVSLQSSLNNAQILDTRGHRCGGTLITLQHVLTTASCLFDFTNNGSMTLISPNNYHIFGGSTTLANSSADRIRPIANFTVHPEFIGAPAHLNDIAIVTLTVPFANTTVVPLALTSLAISPPDFTLCTVAGWGATTTNTIQTSPIMRYSTKYVYSQELCTRLYNGQQEQPNIFDTMVCAASYDILSTGCQGDSGNALVCNGTLTGLLFHHNNCVATSFPELYTRVGNYTSWIRSITSSTSMLTPAFYMLITQVSFFVVTIIVS